jgi:beta-ribofuranosylaminobenzene 5'-phosphate synthase
MTHAVRVRAPCRLHFGMFGFGRPDQPQFGGVGVMVEPPAVEIEITPASRFTVSGTLPERVQQFANLAARAWHLPAVPPCEINARTPSDHVGLGVGTQVALAVAAGLRRFLELPELSAESLAVDVGRGTRSAVGTHGFQRGGLIVDAGHTPGQSVGTLARRVKIPSPWRFVLVLPANERGLAGPSEADAFARLPSVPDGVTRQLWRIVGDQMLPAIERSDCGTFGDAAYQFGRLAGECFTAVQGGPFASREIAQLIEIIRGFGIPGVGQSSWGPTVFAICSSDVEALSLRHWLSTRKELSNREVWVARPSNQGAVIT